MSLSNCSRGLLYIATGTSYIQEAVKNVVRSRPFLEGIKTCIVTDSDDESLHRIFDFVLPHPSPVYSYRDKLLPLQNLPFEETLFLDTDACLINPASDIFAACSLADFAAVYSPVRLPPGWRSESVPSFFPEVNSGVMYFKVSDIQMSFVATWIELYDSLFNEYCQKWDQASLRHVVWMFMAQHNFRFHVLPSEVNLRTTKPWTVGRGLSCAVIHGRFSDSEFDDFVNYLNADIDRFRFWSEWLSLHPETTIRPRYDRTFY